MSIPPPKPHSGAQERKLWAEARDRGWHRDQVYGRAIDILPQVRERGLEFMTMGEMSRLIDAVMTEVPWVDPRQQRLPL